jgi:hypothetical protein
MLILPLIASINIKRNYNKYKKIRNFNNVNGAVVARHILDNNGLTNIAVYEQNGVLSDHYDPTKKCVVLSSDIYNGVSIASVAVAAHECGHALQDKEGYPWMRFRSAIVPIVNIGEHLAYIILFVSLILAWYELTMLAILLTGLGLIFQLITLPVEINASARAMRILQEYGMVDRTEYKGVKKVLRSAALTYIAGVLSSALNMVYLFLRFGRRND